MIATIIEIQERFGRHQVVYPFQADDGVILGPKLELRPLDEDHQAWLDSLIPSVSSQYSQPKESPDDILIDDITQYDDATLKRALGMSDKQVQDVKAKKINATSAAIDIISDPIIN